MRKHQMTKRITSRMMGGHHPASVMVLMSLQFCEKRVETSAKVYQETVLKRVVKPLNTNYFQGKVYVFQKGFASGYKDKTAQD